MRCLAITNRLPNSWASGYDLRVLRLCQALHLAGHSITLLAVAVDEPIAGSSTVPAECASYFESMTVAAAYRQGQASLMRHFRLNENDYLRLRDADWYEAVQSLIRTAASTSRADRLIVFGSNLSGLIPADLGVPSLMDVCDSVTLTLERDSALAGMNFAAALRHRIQWQRWRRAEGNLSRRFSKIAAISRADADCISRLNGGVPIAVIPNGVDQSLLAHAAREPTKNGVVFWGNLDFGPNAQAVRFFIEKVHQPMLAPLGIEFCLIGRNAPSWMKVLVEEAPCVRMTGYVEDLANCVSTYPVMVAPLISGSGLKNKVLEAFALGIPVVASGLAVEAIEKAVSGEHFLLAESPEQYAREIRALLTDSSLRKLLSSRARDLVEAHYSWKHIGSMWCQWVENDSLLEENMC